MGYYFRISGRLRLDPSILFEDAEEAYDFESLSWIAGLEPIIEGVDGIYFCSGFRPHGEPSKLYNLESDIKNFLKKHPGRKFKGVLLFSGENQGDVYQWFIDGDTKIERRPQVIWPDSPAGFEEFKRYYNE